MARKSEPLHVALTVDADADANRPAPGREEAASPGGKACYDACTEGLRTLSALTGELRLTCTIFWEAHCLQALGNSDPALLKALMTRADIEHGCHGLAHEDFAGRANGRPIGAERTLAILSEASELIARAVGAQPAGFRAPYCRLTPSLEDALRTLHYRYDASLTRSAGARRHLRPYLLPPRQPGASPLHELAMSSTLDAHGRRMTGYLWRLFEGTRQPQEYVDYVSGFTPRFGGGLLQLALHPWHLCVDQDGHLQPARRRSGALSGLRRVLEAVAALPGVRFTTAGGYLREHL